MRPCGSIRILVALLPLILFGCGGDDSAPAASGVTLTPTNATVPVGGRQNFTVTVTGLANTAVTWSVQEGANGGSVTAAGVYTAPNTPGTFHVIATSQADSAKHVSAVVTVQAGAVQGTIQ
jgi:hypothetical protein